jgi:outer membrane receptor for Fe3+-dicitrate
MRFIRSVPLLLFLAAAPACAAEVEADKAVTTVTPLDVVAATPLDTSGQSIDRLPSAASVLSTDDLVRAGPASTLRALDERLGGVSLDQAQANPFQPSLIYRGFEGWRSTSAAYASTSRSATRWTGT